MRSYFARQGKDSDEEIRRFADSAVDNSRQAVRNLWAIKKLLNQFTAEEIKNLSPESRAKWLSLIRSHAGSYRDKSGALRRSLKPVFFAGADDSVNSARQLKDTEDLRRTFNELFEVGTTNDKVIRSAFTASSSGAAFSTIRSNQFWQSLKNAEALSAAISSVK